MDILQEIWDGLKRNKMRTVLTGLSVSWGIFILIVLLGAGNGLSNGVAANFYDRATNTVQMWPGQTSVPYRGYQSGRRLNFSERELEVTHNEVREMSAKTPIIEKHMLLTNQSEYGSYNVYGVTPEYASIFNIKIDGKDGRFFNERDMLENRKVIVLDKRVEEVLFRNESALGKTLRVGQINFQVIGINSKKARWGGGNTYIPYSTAQALFNPDKKIRSIAMSIDGLTTKEQNEEFNERLRNTMSQSLLFDPSDNQALWIWNSQRDYLETMNIMRSIKLFVGFIGILTLIAGIVGVSNIMLVTVKERTREIGIRKAIGAPPANILLTVIIESVLITGFFGYIGMMAGIGLTELVNMILLQSAAANPSETGMSVFMNPTVNLTYVYISTLILVIAGVIAGYMPAYKAVKIKPVEALAAN